MSLHNSISKFFVCDGFDGLAVVMNCLGKTIDQRILQKDI